VLVLLVPLVLLPEWLFAVAVVPVGRLDAKVFVVLFLFDAYVSFPGFLLDGVE
jgi:hypothetical protein